MTKEFLLHIDKIDIKDTAIAQTAHVVFAFTLYYVEKSKKAIFLPTLLIISDVFSLIIC